MVVELRSGTNTGGQEPRIAEGRDPNIPEDIEVIDQGDQMANQGAQMMDPTNQQGQPAEGAAQGVYVGGTYPATLARAAQGSSYTDHHNLHSQLHQPDLYKRNLNQLSHMRKVMYQVQNLESHYQHLGGLLLLKHQ
jgi:hypothetical protein